MIAQVLFAQSKEEIISNFVNSIKKNDIVQYSLQYSFNDESKGKNSFSVKCVEMLVPEDTIIGAYYNFLNETTESHSIYAGNDYYYYCPIVYGYGVVRQITKKKNPAEFSDRKIKFDGMEGYIPNVVTASSFYSTSIAFIWKILSENGILSRVSLLSDTIINKNECNRLKFESKLIAFDKKSKMPVYYLYDIGVQQTEAFYSDYKFNAEKKKKLFSKAAFPKKFKFSSNPKGIETYLKAGKKAPDFEVNSLNNKKTKLSDLKGNIIFLYVSEIGCPPCMQALPFINQIAEDFKDLVILGIYPLDSKDALMKLTKDKKLIFDIYPKSKDLKIKYGVNGYPTFFIIDAEGIIRYSSMGYYKEKNDILVNEIKKAINK